MTNIIFSPTLQAPINLANPTGSLQIASDPSSSNHQANPVPTQGAISLVGLAVKLALAMATNAGGLAVAGAAPSVIRGTVTSRVSAVGAVNIAGVAPTLTISAAGPALTFPRIALVGNGGDQSYGSNATTGFPKWTTAAAANAANVAIQTIGAYDLAILAGVFEGWDTSGARDREDLVQALLKNGTYAVTKNNSRPTLAFFYHAMNEGNPSGSGTGFDLLIAQINAMNGWLYESAGGVGTKTPSAFAGNLINYATVWPTGPIGSAQLGEGIVGRNYGSLSVGSPTGAQGVARTNGNYAADKLLIKGATGDTRWTFNAQMAAPSAAGVMLDNCFVALDGAGTVANSSLDGINLFPGAQQGGGFPALDTVQPLLARGIHNFFDQMQIMTATYGTPGKIYYNFGNLGQYANKYQFGTATLTCGLESTMHGGLLEDVMGAGAPSWEYQQTGKAGGGNWLSGAPNVLANYYQAMDFCIAPKLVVLAIRLPSASTPSSWVNGGGSTLVSVTAGAALEYQEMRCGLCNALMDDGYFGVGVSGYDWATPRWYDEFGDDSLAQVNVKRGYMGLPVTTRPTSPTFVQGPIGVYSRAFTGLNGLGVRVLWNPRGNGVQTVALGGTYRALTGTQQPSINNGAYMTSVTLADGDGRVLLGPMAALQITTTSPLAAASQGTAYSNTYVTTGGAPPITWSLPVATPNSAGWYNVSSAGVGSGTPGTAETESLTVQAKDSVGTIVTKAFSLVVNPSGGNGLTPNAGITFTGTFADGQTCTITRAAGGFGARVNALPYLYFPMETNLSTHPTLSRNQYTFTGLSNGSNPTIQGAVAPANAAGAVAWTPLRGGSTSGFSTAFADQPYWTLSSPTYICVKRCQGFNADTGNVKSWRAWQANMAWSEYFGASGQAFAGNDPTENTTGLTGGGRFNGSLPRVTGTWYTDETWFKESSLNNTDGIWNWARQGVFAFDFGGRWQNAATSPNAPGPFNTYYLDEYTGSPPNGSTDKAYLGMVYVDDSWLQLIVTDEGGTYQTQKWGVGGTAAQREPQIQITRTDTQIQFVVRKGSHASLTGKHLIALTGYGTYIDLGVGA